MRCSMECCAHHRELQNILLIPFLQAFQGKRQVILHFHFVTLKLGNKDKYCAVSDGCSCVRWDSCLACKLNSEAVQCQPELS